MDNAVKALIIAGAVLIAILLIGVGITIFNSASQPLDQAQKQSASQEITMFNNNILANVGENLSAATIKTLISTVNSSNKENLDRPIVISWGNDGSISDQSGKTGVIDKVSNISTKSKYNAKEGYDDDGYINTITVTQLTKTTK